MSNDVTEQQTVALKAANVFSVAPDRSIDIDDSPRLAVVARYCSNARYMRNFVVRNLCMALPKEKYT